MSDLRRPKIKNQTKEPLMPLNPTAPLDSRWTQYELINPSDPYHFHAPSDRVAAFCALGVGNGTCDAQRVCDGGSAGGLLIFLSEDEVDARILEYLNGEGDVDTVIERFKIDHARAIDIALRSFIVGDRDSHEALQSAIDGGLEDVDGFLDKWHDSKRSSMNNYRKRALALADSIEGERTSGESREKA